MTSPLKFMQIIIFFAFVNSQVHKITSVEMQNAVHELHNIANCEIDDQHMAYLLKKQGLEYETAISFLQKDTQIIKHISNSKKTHPTLLIHSDRELITDLLIEAISLPGFNIIKYEMGIETQLNEETSIHTVLFQKEYNADVIRDFYKAYSAFPEATFLTSYLKNKSLVIDGLYSPSLGLPCHFCKKIFFESSLQEVSPAAQTLISTHTPMKPRKQFNFTRAHSGLIAMMLKHELEATFNLNSLGTYSDRLGTSSLIDLETGSKTHDKAFHWEACNCLQGEWS